MQEPGFLVKLEWIGVVTGRRKENQIWKIKSNALVCALATFLPKMKETMSQRPASPTTGTTNASTAEGSEFEMDFVTERRRLMYDHFNAADTVVDIGSGEDEDGGGAKSGGGGGGAPVGRAAYVAPPVSGSWYFMNVVLPSRLAVLSMGCIVGYEVCVLVAMAVRSFRWKMVDWLMYVLLAVNACMLLCLAGFVIARRRDVNVSAVTNWIVGRGGANAMPHFAS
jgi:hypothetical protein